MILICLKIDLIFSLKNCYIIMTIPKERKKTPPFVLMPAIEAQKGAFLDTCPSLHSCPNIRDVEPREL